MTDALAPASFMPSATVAKTGLSRWVCPAFLGFVLLRRELSIARETASYPPTTFVP